MCKLQKNGILVHDPLIILSPPQGTLCGMPVDRHSRVYATTRSHMHASKKNIGRGVRGGWCWWCLRILHLFSPQGDAKAEAPTKKAVQNLLLRDSNPRPLDHETNVLLLELSRPLGGSLGMGGGGGIF